MKSSVYKIFGMEIEIIPMKSLLSNTCAIYSPLTKEEISRCGGDINAALIKYNKIAVINNVGGNE